MTATGVLIADRYRVVEHIATGGMGSVWKAWDELLQRPVAVKEVFSRPGLSAQETADSRRRVIREARMTARLHHPNAVTLFDVVEHDDRPWLVMQYVPSRSLSAVLREQGVLEPGTVARIGMEIASALAAAHRVDVVHRDVKPSNVLITDDGSAKLTDFGISSAIGDATLTPTGILAGTPGYLAPEVARGGRSGLPADVFSLGATLYSALEGSPPFGTDPNPIVTLHRAATGQIDPPRRGGALTPLLLRMLAAEPRDRPRMIEACGALATLATQISEEQTTRISEEATARIADEATTRQLGATSAGSTVRGTPTVEERPAGVPQPTERLTLVEEGPLVPGLTALPAPTPSTRRRRLWILLAVGLVLLVAGGAWIGSGLLDGRSTGGSGSGIPTGSDSQTGSGAVGSDLTASSGPGASTSEVSASAGQSASSPDVSDAATPGPTDTAEPSPTDAAQPESDAVTPPADGSSASATTDAPAGAAQPTTSAELAAFVSAYYQDLPANTDVGWQRLTGGFRSGSIVQNRDYYDRFWGSVDVVTATDITATEPDTVDATITYYFDDGRVAVERTRFRVVQEDGTLKIDDQLVLSSQQQ